MLCATVTRHVVGHHTRLLSLAPHTAVHTLLQGYAVLPAYAVQPVQPTVVGVCIHHTHGVAEWCV